MPKCAKLLQHARRQGIANTKQFTVTGRLGFVALDAVDAFIEQVIDSLNPRLPVGGMKTKACRFELRQFSNQTLAKCDGLQRQFAWFFVVGNLHGFTAPS